MDSVAAATAAPPPQKAVRRLSFGQESAEGGCCGSRPKSAGRETRRDQAVQAARGGYSAGGDYSAGAASGGRGAILRRTVPPLDPLIH
jgi:hypothetical protein